MNGCDFPLNKDWLREAQCDLEGTFTGYFSLFLISQPEQERRLWILSSK